MLKKIIAAAVVLSMSAVYIGAQEVEIDFDGKSDIQKTQNIEGFSISDIIAEKVSNLEIEVPEMDSLNKKIKGSAEWTIMVFVNS
ncbi:MAG: hypothetical protein KAR84_03655, partial [Elusimicrobiales bacterium]|nr:hypothetical protein [Elusimicrobiales bacterium]